MEAYTTIRKEASYEYEDRRSVFIAVAAPVSEEREALDFIARIKKNYSDANHCVYAYVIRKNSIMRFSDDREPQGTAGLPVLDAIRKNSCTDTVIAVVRYFGGTLLGTGGLVRAYGSAAIGALRAAEIITYALYTSFEIELTYSDYQKVIPILEASGFRISSTDYSDVVKILGSVKSECAVLLENNLREITGGRCILKTLGEKFEF